MLPTTTTTGTLIIETMHRINHSLQQHTMRLAISLQIREGIKQIL